MPNSCKISRKRADQEVQILPNSTPTDSVCGEVIRLGQATIRQADFCESSTGTFQLDMTANPEEEAWTFVSSKRNRQSKRRAPPVAGTISHTSAPVRTTPNLPVEEIRTDYKKFSQQWTNSKCCRKLKEVLQSKSCHPRPQKAICLGLGSFDPEDGSWQTRRRSHIQLAAFVTLVESLEKDPKEKMRCIFQEPCFTTSDIDFLESLGYEVLDSPGGFEAVSEDSIVFGIHLYRDIYTAAIGKAIPTMFIGTGYDVWER